MLLSRVSRDMEAKSARQQKSCPGGMRMQVGLVGQVALVTGIAGSIGRAIAEQFESSGAHVVGSDRRTADVPFDLGRLEDTIDLILGAHGKLDIFVHDARTVDSGDNYNPLGDTERVLRAAARPMVAAGAGRIVTLISSAGLVAQRRHVLASATAAGIASLTRALALHLAGHGVRVNAIALGAMADTAGHVLDTHLLSHTPRGCPAVPREVAQATLFLADPENSYMTGHVLAVDGGWSAGYTRDF
jgi:3-oxoacyl-[acyl-carrier protein] reductase